MYIRSDQISLSLTHIHKLYNTKKQSNCVVWQVVSKELMHECSGYKFVYKVIELWSRSQEKRVKSHYYATPFCDRMVQSRCKCSDRKSVKSSRVWRYATCLQPWAGVCKLQISDPQTDRVMTGSVSVHPVRLKGMITGTKYHLQIQLYPLPMSALIEDSCLRDGI